MQREGGKDRPSTSREKVRSHAVGMLERGVAGVTAPFFTAIIRASCQREAPEDEEGGGQGIGRGGKEWECSVFERS